METYILFNCQGYDYYDKEKDVYMNVTSVSVIASTESEALEKAKERHPDKNKFRCIGSTEYIKKND